MKLFLLLIFFTNSSAITITCNFDYKDWLVLGNGIYTCDVISMNFAGNSTHITSHSGGHKWWHNNNSVNMVSFSKANCPLFNLKTFPKGLVKRFPNIIGLHLESCDISLNGDELDEFPNLERYTHYYSNLTRVPGNLFALKSNMKFVGFAYNQITNVGEDLLDHLQKLQIVNFESNACVNKIASTPSQIPLLIASLRENCSDIKTATQPSTCGIENFDHFVCGLDEKNKILKEEIQVEVENLREENSKKIENLRKIFEVSNLKNEALEAIVEELKVSKEEMRKELEKQAETLKQLDAMVIYLSTRPDQISENNLFKESPN